MIQTHTIPCMEGTGRYKAWLILQASFLSVSACMCTSDSSSVLVSVLLTIASHSDVVPVSWYLQVMSATEAVLIVT